MKKYHMGLAPLLIVLLVAVIGGGGGVWYMKHKSSSDTLPQESVIEVEKNTVKETIEDTSPAPKKETPTASISADISAQYDFTDFQKQEYEKQMEMMKKMGSGLLPKEEEKAMSEVVATSILKASEAGVKATMEKIIPNVATVYYDNNMSFGISNTNNFCGDQGFLYAVESLKQYTKAKVMCTVNSSFPAKAYTVIVASTTQKGYQYCTDQTINGELILTNGGYKAGQSCK